MVLGRLGDIVEDLPRGQTLGERYASPAAEGVPALLLEVFNLRASLRESAAVPAECVIAVDNECVAVRVARRHWQRSRTPFIRRAARRKFIAACITLFATVVDSELELMERRIIWDSLVRLLRGKAFIGRFNFEESDEPIEEPLELSIGAFSETLYSHWHE